MWAGDEKMRHVKVNPRKREVTLRKVMLLAAMLAMVLAAAAPAFAQAVAGDVNVQYVDCSQVQAAAAAQGQYGDANADASGVSTAAAAEIAQELGITQAQVNACLGGIEVGDDEGSVVVTVTASGSGSASSSASASASASAATLPDTGGASLFALGAGALLVAGGLLARRIVR